MSEYHGDPATDSAPCERCGGSLHLLTTLQRTGVQPGFRIFGCIDCNFIKWLAESSGEHRE